MSEFRVATPAFGLSVERATTDVPDDGRYHVLFQGEVLASERSEKKALRIYRAKRQELMDAGWRIPAPERPQKEEQLRRIRTDEAIRGIASEKHQALDRQNRPGRGREHS